MTAGGTIRPRIHFGLFSAALLACVGACETESAPGKAEIASEPPTVLELQPYVGRLVTVTGRLNGDSLRLLFDSGGGETLLAPWVAADIPCEPAGRSVGFRMSGERVQLPGSAPHGTTAAGGAATVAGSVRPRVRLGLLVE